MNNYSFNPNETVQPCCDNRLPWKPNQLKYSKISDSGKVYKHIDKINVAINLENVIFKQKKVSGEKYFREHSNGAD